MQSLTYLEHGKFGLMDKPKPELLNPWESKLLQ